MKFDGFCIINSIHVKFPNITGPVLLLGLETIDNHVEFGL
jgi:hypothetical protein